MSTSHKVIVLARYRELLRLVARLPQAKRGDALGEARTTIRDRRSESSPEEQLKHLKELISRIGFLRIVTPKDPGEVRAGVFVVRDGRLVEGSGDAKGGRVADGTISMEEGVRRNERDFKRLYGAAKPKGILF